MNYYCSENKIQNKINFITKLMFILVISAFNSCEDPIPTDYKQEKIVEAYLYVGQPISNILIRNSLALSDSILYQKSVINNAVVKIIVDNDTLNLDFDFENNSGYYYNNIQYLVEADKKYFIKINFNDGKEVIAETFTPKVSEWIKKANKNIQFPLDSIRAIPTDTIAWKPVLGQSFYMLAVICLDTLNYGKYQTPPTNELNRRIERSFRSENFFKEIAFFTFVPNDNTPVVWSAFKWYGNHEVALYSTDWNMTRWFLQVQASREYTPLLGSVSGNAIGVFGSAAAIRDTFFLVKNQP